MYWLDDGGGAVRGSANCVTAWQIAQRMDRAPGGSCNGVWQLEQFTSIIMADLCAYYLTNLNKEKKLGIEDYGEQGFLFVKGKRNSERINMADQRANKLINWKKKIGIKDYRNRVLARGEEIERIIREEEQLREEETENRCKIRSRQRGADDQLVEKVGLMC